MAFNPYNPYQQPLIYQQIPQTPQMPQQTMQPIQRNGRIYVQGEAAGKSYLVAPNSSVDLWDAEAPYIYVKSADANGVPIMRKLRYVDETDAPPVAQQTTDYATKDDIEALRKEIEALKGEPKKDRKVSER